MLAWDKLERLKREADVRGRYSIHLSIVLSVIVSLAAVVIISKKDLTNHLWADAAAFALPIPIALYFRNRIVRLGAFGYTAALILFLAAAVLFGV